MFKNIFKREYVYHIIYMFESTKGEEEVKGIGGITLTVDEKINSRESINKLQQVLIKSIEEEKECQNVNVGIINIIKLKK